MIVECQNCQTKFNVDPGRIKEGGSKVKCSSCGNIFKIFRPAPEPVPEPPAPPEEPLFETGAPEEALGGETPAESPAEATEANDFGQEAAGDDLDLGGLGDDMGEAKAGPALDESGSDDDDLDFGGLGDDLDLGESDGAQGPEAATPGEFGEAEDDLDFGGLGDDLDLGEPGGAQGSEAATPGEFGKAEDDLDFGGLGDDLDLGEPDGAQGSEAATPGEFGEAEDDLDFGGLGDDLDLGEPDGAKGSEAATPGEFGEAEDDLDFGGLDDDLGLGEAKDEAEEPRVGTDDLDDLDFDGLDDAFGMDEETEDAGQTQAVDPSFEAGDDVFGDLDLGEEPDATVDDDHGFNFGENTLLGDELVDQDEAPFDDDDDVPYMGDYDEQDEADFSAEFSKPQVKKRRGCLWILIFIFLVLAGLAGVFFYSPHMLDPVLKPLGLITEEPQATDDPQGNKYISPENAKHFFRQNENEGQLLVITGLAKNHYPTARSFIRLKGLLHDAKGQVLAEKQVYCGNLLTEEELSTMSMEDIQKRLNARGGQDGENVNVQPGQSVRFMIVFNQIPIDLAEYTVEAYSSEPADSK